MADVEECLRGARFTALNGNGGAAKTKPHDLPFLILLSFSSLANRTIHLSFTFYWTLLLTQLPWTETNAVGSFLCRRCFCVIRASGWHTAHQFLSHFTEWLPLILLGRSTLMLYYTIVFILQLLLLSSLHDPQIISVVERYSLQTVCRLGLNLAFGVFWRNHFSVNWRLTVAFVTIAIWLDSHLATLPCLVTRKIRRQSFKHFVVIYEAGDLGVTLLH